MSRPLRLVVAAAAMVATLVATLVVATAAMLASAMVVATVVVAAAVAMATTVATVVARVKPLRLPRLRKPLLRLRLLRPPPPLRLRVVHSDNAISHVAACAFWRAAKCFDGLCRPSYDGDPLGQVTAFEPGLS
jgi:hypothetical protein